MAKAKKDEEVKNLPAKAGVPDWMKEYAGEGQEDITRDDIKMPRLKLGQALSTEVKDKKAEEGDLIHNITREVICKAGDTIRIIPVAYSKEYILWRDRKNGGGIMARARRVRVNDRIRYAWDKPNQVFEDKLDGKLAVKYKTKKFIDEDGLADWGSQIPGDADSKPAATVHHNYVVILPDHENQLVALSLSRTAAGKGEEFNTMLKMGTAPTYARIYKLSTFVDQRGEDRFANYQFAGFDLVQDQNAFQTLRDLHQGLKEKGINVDFSDEDTAAAPQTAAENNGKF